MAIKPDYEAGTVSITNGTTTLTGVNTFWVLAKIQKGDTFKVKNLDAIIEEVVSNTEITLKEAWTGGDLAGTAYAIRYQPDGSRFAGAYVEIRDLLANGNLTAFAALVGALDLIPIFTGAGALTLIPKNELIQGVQTNEKVDTLAERAAFDTEAKGFTVLVADVGNGRSAIYFKASGASADWSDPAYLTGPSGSFQSEGLWSAATTYEDGQVVSYQGSSWISLQDTNLNHAPPTLPTTSNAWWTILSRRGDGFTFRGDYAGATAYLKDDAVVNQNSLWLALLATTGNAPPTLPTTSNVQWKLVALGKTGTFRGDYAGGDTYVVGDTVLYNNSTWIAIAPTTGNAPPALPTTVNTWWQLQAARGSGDVSGPASSVARNIAVFSDATGKSVSDSGVPIRTADKRNILYNPDMAISQENGVNVLTTNGAYAADGWQFVFSGITAGTVNFRQVGATTPQGSATRVRATVVTADATVNAGDILFLAQNIEGNRLFDLRWGNAWASHILGASQAVAKIGVRGPAGTYTLCLRSAATPFRVYNANFTISAGEAMTDVYRTFVIPPDAIGTTFSYGVALGLSFHVVLMSGTTWQAPNNAWANGNLLGTSTTSNFMAVAGQTFDLFDCQFHPDPFATGIVPEWERPDVGDSLITCRRYWQRWTNTVVETNGLAQSVTATIPFRTDPVISGGGAGFSAPQNTPEIFQFYQTARAYQTLILNARP